MRRKLNLGFIVIILLLWAICIYTLLSSMSVLEAFVELKDDIVPGAIAMTEMDGTANQIAHGTVEYILTGDAEAKAEVQTASEWLENSLAAHKEHEINIGYLEKKEAEKLEEAGKKLISVANEIINLKDQGVSKEVLLKKENEELDGALYPFVEHVMSHKAEHLQELSAAETKVHGKHYANIKYTIILGLVTTLLALFIALLVDRLFMRFITERKQAEETLWESEKKYRDLAESIGELVYRADPETFVASYVNKAIESLYGYTPEEWLEDPSLWENSIYPDDKERVFTKFTEAQNKMENALAEYRIVRKDKTVRWVEDHLSWGKDPQNNVVSMNGVMYDITERKQAEEALRESEEKYRTLFEYSRDAIYINTKEGEFIDVNQSFLDLFGYTREEMAGRNAADDYANPDDRLRFTDELLQKGFIKDFEVKYKKKNGTEMDCLVTATGQQSNDGSILRYQGIIRDITERKKAEEVSRKAAALETLSSVLDNFIGDSLSNLLTPVYGQIELCEIRDSIEQIKSELGYAKEGITELLTGISAYRKFSKAGESSLGKISSEGISSILGPLLSGQPLKTYGNGEFTIDPSVKLQFTYNPKQKGALSLDELPSVSGSKLAIETALQETLINAVESYDPKKGGDVMVSAKKEDHNLILEIADKGRGMSNDERDKSQLPFFKVLGVKGSDRLGLGAYVALESVKYCGGDIHIESTEGAGTTASISFKVSDWVS